MKTGNNIKYFLEHKSAECYCDRTLLGLFKYSLPIRYDIFAIFNKTQYRVLFLHKIKHYSGLATFLEHVVNGAYHV